MYYAMHENTLLKVALITSVLGVALLFFISAGVDVDAQSIARIDEIPEGKEIEVTGVVVRAHDREKVLFLTIAEEKVEDVTVVLFKNGKVNVQEGDVVTVTGSIDEYEGKKQIIGNRVEKKK
jgi:aspartyl/asparaginyl-tRNA synthetase